MVSGSQATVRTCNDYSGTNVQSFCSRWGLHDTLSSLTVIMKVLVKCIIEPAIDTYVSDFDGAIKRKKQKKRSWQNYDAVPVTFIYGGRHYDHHK